MAEDIVLLIESSSDGEKLDWYSRLRRRRQKRKRRRLRRQPRRGLQAPLEIIDLTEDDLVVRRVPCNDFGVNDLTEAKETMVSPLHGSSYVPQGFMCSTLVGTQPARSPKILAAAGAEDEFGVPVGAWDRDCEKLSPKEEEQPYFQSSSFSLIASYDTDSECISHTTYNSDLGSLGSPQLESDVFSLSSSNDSTECQAFLDCVKEPPRTCLPEADSKPWPSPTNQRHSPSPIPSCSPGSLSTSLVEADLPLLEANNPAPSAVKLEVQEPAKRIDLKVWLKTLQYFQGVPVHHPFLQNVVQEKDARQNQPLKVQPIPSRRLSMVSSTIEENFFQGTLDFLMDYVSCQHYPPKEITSCVVRQILLSPEHQDVQPEIQKDAYMLLMKIQAYISHVLVFLCLMLTYIGLLILSFEKAPSSAL